MKQLFITVFSLLALSASAQLIRTYPEFFRETDTVRIIFDATQGNRALAGFTGNVFVHTGVITNTSTGPSDWQHVITGWGTNIPGRNQATRIGQDLYEFIITPSVREFYDVTNDTITVERIAILFRNASGSIVGRAEGGGDIFIDLFLGDFGMRITSPQPGQFFDPTDNVEFSVVTSSNADITFFLNGTEVTSATDVNALTHTYSTFSAERYEFVARAVCPTYGNFYDTLFLNIRSPRVYEPVPAGARDGINTNFPNPGDVTFVLRVPKRTSPQPTVQSPNTPQTYVLGRNSVHMIGDFNNWQPSSAYQLKGDTVRLAYWITLSGLDPDNLYRFQYLVDETQRITDPYTELILDPWNDHWINHYSQLHSGFDIFPDMPEFPTNYTTGLVATFQINRPEFQWSPEALAFVRPVQQDLIIYELLIRDFMMFPSYDRIIEHKFQHLIDLGINAIKILPNMEFDGNNSWGYNPNHMFAVDKAYGTAESFKRFIDKAHSHGIAIILDIVLNHQTGSSPLTQLFWDSQNNRPCADHNPWFHPEATHPWNVFYQMNHRSKHTVYFSERVAEFWMREFRVDGFRFDLSKAFTFLGPNNDPAMSAHNPVRIQYWNNFADFMWNIDSTFYVILEHFAVNTEERDLANHGLSEGRPGMMIWGNMNHAYSQLAMGWASGSSLDWAFAKEGRRNAAGNFTGNRGWGAHNLIVYAESHDEERVSTRVGGFVNAAGTRIHAGYGNRTADGSYSTRYRQAERKALVAAFMIPLPGPTMIWQFGEFAFDGPLNICYSPSHLGGSGIGTFPANQSGLGGGAGNCRTGRSPLLWHYLERESNRFTFYVFSGLINMRLNHPAFTDQRDFFYQTAGGNTHLQRWIIAESMVPDSSVVIVGNFDTIQREFTIPGIPANGVWHSVFTTDEVTVTNNTLNITLPPGGYRVFTRSEGWINENATSVVGFERAEIPMSIFPNPAQDEIFVDFEAEGQREIQIFNLSGQLMQTISTRSQNVRMDVSNLRAGSYILIVTDGASISSQQIIIQ
ncbi:MAG: alpha-amylase family glycosyl hydrolase [Bacteroidales bacterium]|nr:alpha-amylase family glycosyl hydrolase [Bacteroidales bacterium]